MKEFWDFDEKINFSKVKGYKVIDVYPDAREAAKLLNELKFITFRSVMSIHASEHLTPEIELLLKTPFRLQEMQLEKFQGTVLFEGLNKPKGVHTKKTAQNLGKDGKLRATYRVIFLTIRNKNGKLKKIEKPLTNPILYCSM